MKRSTFITLFKNDLRLILRDKLLLVMVAFILVMGIAIRFALPAIDLSLAEKGIMPNQEGGLRFSDTFPMFVAFLAVWQGANIPGIIFGFLLLDEKEDNTLKAIRVTPLPFSTYTLYRVSLPAVMTFFATIYISLAGGICALPLWKLIPIAIGAAFTSPLGCMLFATFAKNKVQGLAFTKFIGIAGLIILIGFFVPEPWQWTLGIFPPFLIAKAYWMALENQPFWIPLSVGILLQFGLLKLLIKRFAINAMV